MSVSNRSLRGKSSSFLDRPNLELPENIGNRRTFEELKIPPDDVGNLAERDAVAAFVHDGLGNSLDEEPSHLRSGILTQLVGMNERASARRTIRDPHRPSRSTHVQRPRFADAHQNPVRPREVMAKDEAKEPTTIEVRDLNNLNAQDYMACLTNEFTRLLRLRLGVPFSFSMKAIAEDNVDDARVAQSLQTIERLIRDILHAGAITASVSYAEYRTAQHRFAVFFVSPKEKDPVKNKDLISALRQIVKLHATANPPGSINVLLVLANAQHVIEDHLTKLGAKKVQA